MSSTGSNSSNQASPLKQDIIAKEQSIRQQNAELEDLTRQLAEVKKAIAENRAAQAAVQGKGPTKE